ncbi:MAG: Biopolymer transport protein ExbD [Elusimicrobia bacterium]|nr:Biopolymer transport protein ExbD [Elusimicrobiota bacterium]
MKIGSANGTGRYHIQAEINMIPLIDVALVLLIIFMVISPILVESQLRVKLPKVSSSPSHTEETALKVEISADGKFALNGKMVTRDAFKTALNVQLPPGHKASLLIQADRESRFNDVVYVMDVAKQLKVENLGVAVLPESMH